MDDHRARASAETRTEGTDGPAAESGSPWVAPVGKPVPSESDARAPPADLHNVPPSPGDSSSAAGPFSVVDDPEVGTLYCPACGRALLIAPALVNRIVGVADDQDVEDVVRGAICTAFDARSMRRWYGGRSR